MPTANEPEPLWHALVAGSFGGFCSVIVAHPFDTMKVWQQLDHRDASSLRGVRLGHLYSGVGAQLAGIVPFWAMFYYGYRLGRRLFPDETSTLHGFFAGAVAGAVATPAVLFAETVKTLAQASRTSSGDALRRMALVGARTGIVRVLMVAPFTLAYMMPYVMPLHAPACGEEKLHQVSVRLATVAGRKASSLRATSSRLGGSAARRASPVAWPACASGRRACRPTPCAPGCTSRC